jgi:hypothetical protein
MGVCLFGKSGQPVANSRGIVFALPRRFRSATRNTRITGWFGRRRSSLCCRTIPRIRDWEAVPTPMPTRCRRDASDALRMNSACAPLRVGIVILCEADTLCSTRVTQTAETCGRVDFSRFYREWKLSPFVIDVQLGGYPVRQTPFSKTPHPQDSPGTLHRATSDGACQGAIADARHRDRSTGLVTMKAKCTYLAATVSNI